MAPETETSPPEQSTGTGQPGPPQGPPSGSFGAVAGAAYGMDDALRAWSSSAGKVRQGLEDKAKAMEPAIASAEKALTVPTPPLPSPPGFTPPPSRQLTEFLAPVEGESPQASITKLLQAVGLFATGIAGSAKGDARAGLAAFTGAMKGWQEGDRERADRHFADWEAKTKLALTKWQTERATYLDIMEANNLTIEQRMKLAHLVALREDNKGAAAAFEMGQVEKGIDFLDRQHKVAQDMEMFTKSLAQAKSIADDHRKVEYARIAAQERETKARLAEIHQRDLERLELPASGRYYDADAGEIRTISKKELMEDLRGASSGGKQRFREMKPAEAQLVERVAIGFPILDRLEQLMDKIQVAAKGENITQGLINRLKLRSGISEDLKEFTTLKLDQALEQAAAMSGGMPRIAILKMLRGEASPSESETIGVGKRAIETTRTTLKNRITQSTGDTGAWQKLSKNLEQYVPKSAPETGAGWKIEVVQ